MKSVDTVLATNRETERAFNAGALAVILGTLGGVALLYYLSVVSVTEMVILGVLGVPVVALTAAVILAGWLGYADEAHQRSMQYAVELNYDPDE